MFANFGVHARIVITFFQIVSTYSSICIEIPWPEVLNDFLNIQVNYYYRYKYLYIYYKILLPEVLLLLLYRRY